MAVFSSISRLAVSWHGWYGFLALINLYWMSVLYRALKLWQTMSRGQYIWPLSVPGSAFPIFNHSDLFPRPRPFICAGHSSHPSSTRDHLAGCRLDHGPWLPSMLAFAWPVSLLLNNKTPPIIFRGLFCCVLYILPSQCFSLAGDYQQWTICNFASLMTFASLRNQWMNQTSRSTSSLSIVREFTDRAAAMVYFFKR